MRRVMIVSLVNPTALELSVWTGDCGCGHPISISVLRNGTISRAVKYSAESSASAADAITNLMVMDSVRIGPLVRGIASFSETKMCAPARLRDFGSLR